MYKRRYVNSKFKKAKESFDDDEEVKEDINLHNLEKAVEKIIKPHKTPIEKLHKKLKNESKSKPINTRILLKGFI